MLDSFETKAVKIFVVVIILILVVFYGDVRRDITTEKLTSRICEQYEFEYKALEECRKKTFDEVLLEFRRRK